MLINSLFSIVPAKSHGTDDYDTGDTPFITNSRLNNGVARFVEPIPGDKVIDAFTICISGLGYATLQVKDYLPKGNGGDSATILIPLTAMTFEELLFYTAQFNLIHGWRFSFGRKASKKRIEKLSFSEVYNHLQIENDFSGNVKRKLSLKLNELNLNIPVESTNM
ncbi:hypothetical protein [Lamprocystis purpurea]|jgi:hypothetical protein|uniref:hypothetical protein n=1 Tax=Lamprocystis purpurea TaxID=61598 RepID=UPI0012FCC92A|nr:hypothetical protein [Lamprocystis purpurea]